MDVYLVRHGETKANARHIYQAPNEPLSAQGASEVARLVRTVQELNPTHLYTSHYKRARETADFLSYATELEAVWQEDVSELRVPEYLFGSSHFGARSLWYLTRWFFNALPQNTHDDIETKEEFLDRIFKVRKQIETAHHGDRVVIVTHSIFTNFFVAHVCQDRSISFLKAPLLLWKILQYENSGITHIRYIGETEKNVCPWQVLKFNGHQHLSEE